MVSKILEDNKNRGEYHNPAKITRGLFPTRKRSRKSRDNNKTSERPLQYTINFRVRKSPGHRVPTHSRSVDKDSEYAPDGRRGKWVKEGTDITQKKKNNNNKDKETLGEDQLI